MESRLACLASLASLWVVAACTDNVGPKIEPCTATDGFELTLAVAEYRAVNPTADSACVRFAANALPDTVEYLVVPQLATGKAGLNTSFSLLGNDIGTATAAQLVSSTAAAALTPAARFDQFLRQSEQARVYGLQPVSLLEAPRVSTAPAAPAAPPPLPGDQRQFHVCATTTCTTFVTVTATARVVKTHLAVFTDDASPAGGLDSADLDTVATLFDSQLYPLDKAAFGDESDVDNNTVVFVLMTPRVNKFVSKDTCAASGFIAGFFYGFDIDPGYKTNPNSNQAEVFYSLAADSLGTVIGPDGKPTCAHTATEVKRLVPVTFIHEFQHMISFNEHVLKRGGNSEVLWLNEGLSHFAEEMGGRSFAVGDTRRTPFLAGDWFNAYQYLENPGATILVTTSGVGTLAERGVEWLFVRYLVDQFGAGLTKKLDQTALTGDTNVVTQTGQPFVRLVTRWALANWVSDLPGFPPPPALPELRYSSESFRALYDSLHTVRPTVFPRVFPIVPTTSSGAAANLTGKLFAGSGVYHRVLQPPGTAAFGLRFISPSGFPMPGGNYVPRLSVIRIR